VQKKNGEIVHAQSYQGRKISRNAHDLAIRHAQANEIQETQRN
jgi:hypothetical protein